MNILNMIDLARAEQLNEKQNREQESLKITSSLSRSWFAHTHSSISQGDRPYMEDFISVTELSSIKKNSFIEDNAKLLFYAMYILGDLLFFLESGSTLICSLTYQNSLIIGNLGDSRACLLTKIDNQYTNIRLNRTHKVNNPIEQIRIQSEIKKFGSRNLDKLFLSRGLGGFGFCPLITYEPEISFLSIEKENSILLLTSDGVSNVLTEEEIISIFLTNKTNFAQALHDQAYIKFKLLNTDADNISIITHELIADQILLLCISDGCYGAEVARLASILVPLLVTEDILKFENCFVPCREFYNKINNTSKEIINNIKSHSYKIISNLLNNQSCPLKEISSWFELRNNLMEF